MSWRKTNVVWRTLALLGVAGLIVLYASYRSPVQALAGSGEGSAFPAASASPTPVACPLFQFNSTVPGDRFLLNQGAADCFAWAEFIPLNWPTTGSDFGAPGLNPVAWETYMTQEELFPPNGGPPAKSGRPAALPQGCQLVASEQQRRTGHLRILHATTKTEAAPGSSFNFPQAFPRNAPAWLGAQNGTNLWYEVLLNPDQTAYVTAPDHQFYNAAKQGSWVNNGAGNPIVFPKGVSNGAVGAIELKAAWMEVPNYDPGNPKWQKYLLSQAIVIGPSNGQCRATTVALVGLHIIHKTQSQPTWVWATFEHVDNVPGPSNTPDCCDFYNAQCQQQQVAVPQSSCLAPGKTSPVTVSCAPNTAPPYNLGVGCPNPVPLQVTRTVPLADVSQGTNTTAWNAIRDQYPNSVFQYYELVDVLWSTNPTQDPTTPQAVPLHFASPASGNFGRVANTTMETYRQDSECTQCHKNANIAPQTPTPPPVWDADFSFAFGSASVATGQAQQRSASVKK